MEKMSSALMYSIFYLETFKITQGLSDLIISIIYFSLNTENEAALQDVEIFIKDNAYTKSLYGNMLAHIVINILRSSVFPMILDKTKELAYGYIVLGLVIFIVGMRYIYKQHYNDNRGLGLEL